MEKISFQFPGQGSQYQGMGKTLYQDYQAAKEIFEEANDVLGYDLKKICFEGSLGELNKTEHMLLAILTVSVAAFRVYMQEVGVRPQFLAGHSLGEYSAITCGGVISFSDALKLVKLRSKLAQEAANFNRSSLTIINGVSESIVAETCERESSEGGIVTIACYNALDQFVITGNEDAVFAVEDALSAVGAQITPLLLSPPFHSPLMEEAARLLDQEFQNTSFTRPLYPIISNVTALPTSEPESIRENLILQMTHPVQWRNILNYCNIKGIDTIIEMGPSAILTNLLEVNNCSIKGYSFGQKDDRELMLQRFSTNKEHEETYSLLSRCLAIAVCTKNRNWDDEEYIKGVEQPYEEIERIQDELEQKGLAPTEVQMKQALVMLLSVFRTKHTPYEEQVRRFQQVFNETGTWHLFPNFIAEEVESTVKEGG